MYLNYIFYLFHAVSPKNYANDINYKRDRSNFTKHSEPMDPMVPMAHFPALLGHRRAAAPPGQLMPACVVVASGAEGTDDIHLRFSNNAGKPALYKC